MSKGQSREVPTSHIPPGGNWPWQTKPYFFHSISRALFQTHFKKPNILITTIEGSFEVLSHGTTTVVPTQVPHLILYFIPFLILECLRDIAIRGHPERTSHLNPDFLTPSPPLSWFVPFGQTPPPNRTSFLAIPPPYYQRVEMG